MGDNNPAIESEAEKSQACLRRHTHFFKLSLALFFGAAALYALAGDATPFWDSFTRIPMIYPRIPALGIILISYPVAWLANEYQKYRFSQILMKTSAVCLGLYFLLIAASYPPLGLGITIESHEHAAQMSNTFRHAGGFSGMR